MTSPAIVDLDKSRTYLVGVYALIRCSIVSYALSFCTVGHHSVHLLVCIATYLLVDRNCRVESVFDINSLCNTLVACHVLNLYRPSEHSKVNEYVKLPPFTHPFVSFLMCSLCMVRIADLSQFGDIRNKKEQNRNVTMMALSVILICSVPYSEENLARNMLLLRYTLFSACCLTWTYSVGITSLILALHRETGKRDGVHHGHIVQEALLCQVRFCFILLVDLRSMFFFALTGLLITIAKSYSIRGDQAPSTHHSYVIQSDNMPGPVLYILNFMGNLMSNIVKKSTEVIPVGDLESPPVLDAARTVATSRIQIPPSSDQGAELASDDEDQGMDVDMHMMFKKQALAASGLVLAKV